MDILKTTVMAKKLVLNALNSMLLANVQRAKIPFQNVQIVSKKITWRVTVAVLLFKKMQQTRNNILKAEKTKNQNQKKNTTKPLTITGIIRINPKNLVTQRLTEKRNYAQTAKATTHTLKK